MSVKSRRRKEREISDTLPPKILFRRKKRMRQVFLDNLATAVFLLLLSIVICLVGVFACRGVYAKGAAFFAAFVFIFMTCIRLYDVVRSFRIFKGIRAVNDVKEDTVTVTCKRVSFLKHPLGVRLHPPMKFVIDCMILTDENGHLYYVIACDYDVVLGIHGEIYENEKKELLHAEIAIKCYAGTNFVKEYQGNKKDG